MRWRCSVARAAFASHIPAPLGIGVLQATELGSPAGPTPVAKTKHANKKSAARKRGGLPNRASHTKIARHIRKEVVVLPRDELKGVHVHGVNVAAGRGALPVVVLVDVLVHGPVVQGAVADRVEEVVHNVQGDERQERAARGWGMKVGSYKDEYVAMARLPRVLRT